MSAKKQTRRRTRASVAVKCMGLNLFCEKEKIVLLSFCTVITPLEDLREKKLEVTLALDFGNHREGKAA
jgi:hypothetical protein